MWLAGHFCWALEAVGPEGRQAEDEEQGGWQPERKTGVQAGRQAGGQAARAEGLQAEGQPRQAAECL